MLCNNSVLNNFQKMKEIVFTKEKNSYFSAFGFLILYLCNVETNIGGHEI